MSPQTLVLFSDRLIPFSPLSPSFNFCPYLSSFINTYVLQPIFLTPPASFPFFNIYSASHFYYPHLLLFLAFFIPFLLLQPFFLPFSSSVSYIHYHSFGLTLILILLFNPYGICIIFNFVFLFFFTARETAQRQK